MTRHLKAEERQRRARARREGALARSELRYPSTPRSSASGATSFPVKVADPAVEAAIAAFMARKEGTE